MSQTNDAAGGIQRWEMEACGTDYMAYNDMRENPDGNYVRYDDHVKAIEGAAKAIKWFADPNNCRHQDHCLDCQHAFDQCSHCAKASPPQAALPEEFDTEAIEAELWLAFGDAIKVTDARGWTTGQVIMESFRRRLNQLRGKK